MPLQSKRPSDGEGRGSKKSKKSIAFGWLPSRRSSGQALSSYSPLAKESLAERVCKMDKSLEQSGIQVPLIRWRIPNNDGGNPSSLFWGKISSFDWSSFSTETCRRGCLWIKKPTKHKHFLRSDSWQCIGEARMSQASASEWFWISFHLKRKCAKVALYENIESYLKSGRDGFESYFTGQMLCLVALICWYLMVAKEAGSGSRRAGETTTWNAIRVGDT